MRFPLASSTARNTPPAPKEITNAHSMPEAPPSVAILPKGSDRPRNAPVITRRPTAEFQRRFIAVSCRLPVRPDRKCALGRMRQSGRNVGSVLILGKYRDRHELDAVLDKAARLVGRRFAIDAARFGLSEMDFS